MEQKGLLIIRVARSDPCKAGTSVNVIQESDGADRNVDGAVLARTDLDVAEVRAFYRNAGTWIRGYADDLQQSLVKRRCAGNAGLDRGHVLRDRRLLMSDFSYFGSTD